ncbi:DUF2269 family protein [Pseudomonas citronellolis]|uniref:DUF2269 family protein n=1 Tax=Pseudomonas citronellolis TaxID=53408 RepID=UPI0023E3C57D|nr:DUF2269 domain-containing protein [Pseudomonas citronellolis]MDF3935279.1 DUF2269 domain-containing protein [Pseudomonas citronellolis]
MSPYLLLKTLHILSATLLFGTGLGSAYYAWRAWRSGSLEAIRVTFRHLVTADWLFIASSAVFQPLSGLAMAHWAGWPLGQGWLLWSLGLYVFAGACWLPVVWLQMRVRDLAEAATAAEAALPPRAFFYMRWWFALGWPAFLAFLAIFWLMVNKPL